MFNKTLSELKKKYQKRALYVTTPAAERANELKKFDICIVDPPRKGLDIEVVEALNNNNNNNESLLTRLIYVSCGFKGFENDCQQLLKRWKIVHAQGFVLFPGSDHIETLAVFDRL